VTCETFERGNRYGTAGCEPNQPQKNYLFAAVTRLPLAIIATPASVHAERPTSTGTSCGPSLQRPGESYRTVLLAWGGGGGGGGGAARTEQESTRSLEQQFGAAVWSSSAGGAAGLACLEAEPEGPYVVARAQSRLRTETTANHKGSARTLVGSAAPPGGPAWWRWRRTAHVPRGRRKALHQKTDQAALFKRVTRASAKGTQSKKASI